MNKVKYNVLLILLVVVLAGIALFSSIAQDASASDEANKDDGIGVVSPDDSIVSDEQEAEEKAPVFATAWSAFNYAYNILQNGKGYYSKTTQDVVAMSFPQKTNIYRYKNAEAALMETWSDGTVSFFEGLYQHDNMVTNRKFSGPVKNLEYPTSFGMQPRSLSLSDFENERGWLPSVIPHVINKDTATASGFYIKLGSNGKKYYNFSLKLNNAASERYLKQVLYCAGSASGSIESVVIDCLIDYDTGYLVKTTKKEAYTLKMFGMNVGCTSTSYETYLIMNKRVVINKPAYM